MNDLDRAATRRLLRNTTVEIEDVFDLYGGILIGMTPAFLHRANGRELFTSIVDVAFTMVYEDAAHFAKGEPSTGSPDILRDRFLHRFGGDLQFAHHICRVILFAVSGIIMPTAEAEVREHVVSTRTGGLPGMRLDDTETTRQAWGFTAAILDQIRVTA